MAGGTQGVYIVLRPVSLWPPQHAIPSPASTLKQRIASVFRPMGNHEEQAQECRGQPTPSPTTDRLTGTKDWLWRNA